MYGLIFAKGKIGEKIEQAIGYNKLPNLKVSVICFASQIFSLAVQCNVCCSPSLNQLDMQLCIFCFLILNWKYKINVSFFG